MAVPVAHALVVLILGPTLWQSAWREVTAISAFMGATFSSFITWKFLQYTKVLRALLYETRHDDLTGLLNRKGLRWFFEKRSVNDDGTGLPVGVLLSIDLDGFKTVNDTHGHQAGDDVLEEFAERLKRSVREGDVVARVGGDEFIVFLNQAGLSQGATLAERMRGVISGSPFETRAGPVAITASIGLIDMEPDRTATEVIKRVDEALYSAKGRGGNVVFVESLAVRA